jgi:glutathione S-transferase
MKLFHSAASPFVRKVMVVALEKEIADEIEKINATVSPLKRNDELLAYNPLGKVPCLVLDDGRALFDSSVIAAYLDGLAAPHLNPDDGPARFDALTLEALADGLLDASVLTRYETVLRPADKQWRDWSDGQMAKVERGLDFLESRWVATLNGRFTIGVIAVACALGYLDFRFAETNWRRSHPQLADFFARIADRPSIQATQPVG